MINKSKQMLLVKIKKKNYLWKKLQNEIHECTQQGDKTHIKDSHSQKNTTFPHSPEVDRK